MSPREREHALLEIVERVAIHTQAELVRALRGRACEVSQATVSRDIKRLGLVKLPTPDGSYRYAAPPAAAHAGDGGAARAGEAVRGAFGEFATGVASGESLLAVKTHSGCANAVAVTIDEAAVPGVVATLAGDDTILILTRTVEDRDRLSKEFSDLV